MERTQMIPKTVMDRRHEFYCDGEGCNKFLGYTTEHDDGWYKELGEFEVNIHILGESWRLHRHLCNECRVKLEQKISEALRDIGFSTNQEE